MDRKRLLRNPLIWILAAILVYFTFSVLFDDTRGYTRVDTSVALAQISQGNVSNALIEDREQRLRLTLAQPVEGSTQIITQYPAQTAATVVETLENASNKPTFNTTVRQDSFLTTMLIYLIPLGLVLLILFWMMNNAQGGGNRVMSFGKSKAKQLNKDMPKTTFGDVAGADEAVEELYEIKDFLQNPARYQALGAKIPKGVLLYGPPGTGKTLLARAVAGEAGVPFYTISGSDFVEMFVGVGASRVRDLFEQAKQNSPCIIFVDEIDAVGRQRGAGLGGGNDEREQTLNQLLVEMDGFESNEGVILVAATNRPDVLDPALLRPGRFDRRIVVNRPDVKGREGILAVHTKKIPLADDVNIHVLARGTSGFSGADLANLVNEAALNAARYNQKVVRMQDFEFAKDKVLMGSERRSMIINDEEKKVTAIHEAGHALLAVLLPHADPVHKVTIIPRGMALGLTTMLPLEDKHNYSREYLNDQIAILLGGRLAEEITMNGAMTTGAGNDLERSTEMARKMVCEWGMSESMGPLTFGKKEEQIFLGREIAQHQDYSEDTAIRIDQEIKRIVLTNYEKAKSLLTQHKNALLHIADALLSREVLDADQVRRIAAGEPLDEPAAAVSSPVSDDGSKRPAKERPSIVPALPPLNKPLTQE
jgi:cell division protease FtsH